MTFYTLSLTYIHAFIERQNPTTVALNTENKELLTLEVVYEKNQCLALDKKDNTIRIVGGGKVMEKGCVCVRVCVCVCVYVCGVSFTPSS